MTSFICTHGKAFPSPLKFSYVVLTFNRSFSMVLKHGLWHELWKTGSLPLTTYASDVFFGFHTRIMLRMLMYDSEPALHRNCCPSWRFRFFGHVARMGDTRRIRTELYIRRLAGSPRTGSAAQVATATRPDFVTSNQDPHHRSWPTAA